MAERDYDDQYNNAADLDAEGIPVLEDPINVDEGMIPPGDQPRAAEDYGVTAAEQRGQEPLAERVLRERPDELREATDAERRLTDGDYDVDDIDDEKDVTARQVGQSSTAESAEESAMGTRPEPT